MERGAIRVERSEHAGLCYHVLAHLHLGRDAASLHDPDLPPRPWVGALQDAYARSRGRLALQFVALETRGLDELLARLSACPPPLDDGDGRALAERFAGALLAERGRYAERRAYPPATPDDALIRSLTALRAVLWETRRGPPPLVIVDCPALRWAGRASARAESGERAHVVGVSLDRPVEHAICQVFHEEVHRVTDGAVLQAFEPHGVGVAARDTRVEAPGYRVHAALEHAAVEAGQAIVDARAPELREAYARWRRRVGAGMVAGAPADRG